MAMLNEAFLFMISYSIIIFGTFFLLNFLTKGFIGKFIRVKASRGKFVLGRIHTVTGEYYVIGKMADNMISYKKRNSKEKDHVQLSDGDIKHEAGVMVVDIEEVSGKVINRNWDAVEGRNIDSCDSLLVRALEKPNLADKTKDMIILFLCVLSLIASALACFLIFNLTQIVQAGGIKGVV